jgi:hypothetical protein
MILFGGNSNYYIMLLFNMSTAKISPIYSILHLLLSVNWSDARVARTF